MTKLEEKGGSACVYQACCVKGLRITQNIYSLASIDEDSGEVWIGEFEAADVIDITCFKCGQSYQEGDFTRIM